VLLVSNDARELGDIETRTTDQGTVDVRLAHESGDVRGLDRATVEDPGCRCGIRSDALDQDGAQLAGDLFCLLGGRGLSRADRPDRLVRDDEVRSIRDAGERRPELGDGDALGPWVSRSSAVSPTQTIGTSECLIAAAVLAATTSSVSLCSVRRSEWPMITYSHSSALRNAPEISPVYAPESWEDRSCPPYLSEYLSARAIVCTERRSVNGGNTATSTFA
jgi:hypothetical protein